MKFAHIRVSEYFTFAEQIFHSKAISLARRANFVEKSTAFAVLFSGGGWWIRTTEVNAQQIYSLPPLAAREIPHIVGHVSDPLELVIGVEPTTC